MKSLLLSLFITGAVPMEAQSPIGDSVASQSNLNTSFNQSDRSCPKNKTDSCLLPNNLPKSINLYPSLFRQATTILLPQWQSPLHPRKQVQLHPHVPSLFAIQSVKAEQHKDKTLIPEENTLPPKFPSVSRSSLILSAPNQEKIDSNKSLLAHPAPQTKVITSPFGWRRRPYSRKMQFHKGIDYGAPLGSPVVAAKDGVVIRVVSGCVDFGNIGCGNQFGNWIEIDHGHGMVAIYAHLRHRSIAVRKGMKVRRNQQIARVGSSGWSTGAHLDFRIKVNGQYKNPRHFVLVKR